jgi:hypothetical protein
MLVTLVLNKRAEIRFLYSKECHTKRQIATEKAERLVAPALHGIGRRREL